MKKLLIKLARLLGGVRILKFFNERMRKIDSFTHYLQYVIEWGVKPVPNWFDHNLDLHYLWHKTRTPLGWERGIFNLLAIRSGAKVLELCCGDGFNSFHFYAIRAGELIAVDFDKDAIRSAERQYFNSNLRYLHADIRTQMPNDKFDNVVWDASLEYFTEPEILQLMQDIKFRLNDAGILSGYSIAQNYRHDEHKYIFRNKEDLIRFLSSYFRNIRVFETKYPSRHNLYFFASDGHVPFDESWKDV